MEKGGESPVGGVKREHEAGRAGEGPSPRPGALPALPAFVGGVKREHEGADPGGGGGVRTASGRARLGREHKSFI